MADIIVFGQLASTTIAKLEKLGRVYIFLHPASFCPKDIYENVKVLIFRSPFTINNELLKQFPALQHVIRAGSGIESVDLEALKIRGISFQLIQADGTAVAELAVGTLLSLIRHIVPGSKSLIEGEWIKSHLVGRQLNGSTVVIVGFGCIGQSLAKILNGFGAHLIVCDRSPEVGDKLLTASKYDVKFSDIDNAIGWGDYIFLCCPLTTETTNLFDENRLSMMKSDSVLINMARAQIVDTNALIDALDSGRLGGACIDVFDTEPPTNFKLLKHSKVLATPHIGAQTREVQKSMESRIEQAVQQVVYV